jgi:pimeloyl-ACP methyl ester carboxylesterase
MLILYAAPCLYRPSLKTRVRRLAAHALKLLGVTNLLPTSLKQKFIPYDLHEANDSGMGEVFRRVVGHDQEKELGCIAVPTQILWGSADAAVPLCVGEAMKTLIPHSHLTVLPHEGHNIHLDNPTLLFGAIRKILSIC